jgi:hypothetical protein
VRASYYDAIARQFQARFQGLADLERQLAADAADIQGDQRGLPPRGVLEHQRLGPEVVYGPLGRLVAGAVAGHPHRFLGGDGDAGRAGFPAVVINGKQSGYGEYQQIHLLSSGANSTDVTGRFLPGWEAKSMGRPAEPIKEFRACLETRSFRLDQGTGREELSENRASLGWLGRPGAPEILVG